MTHALSCVMASPLGTSTYRNETLRLGRKQNQPLDGIGRERSGAALYILVDCLMKPGLLPEHTTAFRQLLR